MVDAQGPESGFTLVEVVVSFVLFAIVTGGAVTGIVNSQRASHASQQRVQAADIAQSYLAGLRTHPATITTTTPTFTANVKSETFTVAPQVAFAGGASQCSAGGSVTVHVVVSAKSTGDFLARNDTVIACP